MLFREIPTTFVAPCHGVPYLVASKYTVNDQEFHDMFTVGRKPFLEACLLAAKSTTTKSTMPILGCLAIKVYNGSITVTGTDLNTEMIACVNDNAIGLKDGLAYVQSSLLIQSLRECIDEEITATLGKNSLKVACGKSSFTFPLGDAGQVPEPFDRPNNFVWGYGREDLIQVLSRSILASSDEEGKYAYDKMYLDGQYFIGTDGKRTVIQELEPSIYTDKPKKSLVTPKSIGIIISLLKASSANDAVIAVSDNLISVTCGLNKVICVLSANSRGLPDNMQRIIPTNMPYRTEFIVGDLLRGVSQASIVTGKESLRVVFEFAGGSLAIKSQNQTGKVESVVQGYVPADMDMKIYFDPTYIKEMLRTLDAKESVVMEFRAPDKLASMDIPFGKYVIAPLVQS
jgi:DNA polymerase-3 subunit beta